MNAKLVIAPSAMQELEHWARQIERGIPRRLAMRYLKDHLLKDAKQIEPNQASRFRECVFLNARFRYEVLWPPRWKRRLARWLWWSITVQVVLLSVR